METFFLGNMDHIGRQIVSSLDARSVRSLLGTSRGTRRIASDHVESEGALEENHLALELSQGPAVLLLKGSEVSLGRDAAPKDYVFDHPVSSQIYEQPTNLRGLLDLLRGGSPPESKEIEVGTFRVNPNNLFPLICGDFYAYCLKYAEEESRDTYSKICLLRLDSSMNLKWDLLPERGLASLKPICVATCVNNSSFFVAYRSAPVEYDEHEIVVLLVERGQIIKEKVLNSTGYWTAEMKMICYGELLLLCESNIDSLLLTILKKGDLSTLTERKRIRPTNASDGDGFAAQGILAPGMVSLVWQNTSSMVIHAVSIEEKAEGIFFGHKKAALPGKRFVAELASPDDGGLLAEEIPSEKGETRKTRLFVVKFPKNVQFLWRVQEWKRSCDMVEVIQPNDFAI